MTVYSNHSAATNPGLNETVQVTRRRLLLIGLGTSLGWALAAGLALVIAAAWLDLALDFPGTIRALLDTSVIVAALFVTGYLFTRAMGAASLSQLARTFDHAAKARGQITAGFDLAASSMPGASAITIGLAQIATRQASKLLSTVHPQDIAPAKPLGKPVGVIGGIAFFVLIIGLTIPRLLNCQWLRFADPFGNHPPYSPLVFHVEPGDSKVIFRQAFDVAATVAGGTADHVDLVLAPEGQPEQIVPMFLSGDGKWQATLADVESGGKYFVRSGRAQSDQFNLGVITVPRIEKVKFRIALPAYTNRPPYEGPLPQTGITGLPGTRVTVAATSNRPLSGGQVTLSIITAATTAPAASSRTIVMVPSGANEAQGVFDITASAKFELKVTDTDGQMSTDSFAGTIKMVDDEKPFVRIIEPYATSFATPDAVINIRAVAEDDYGISRLEVYRSLDDSRFRSTQIPVPTPAPTQFPGLLTLRISDYGLSPGDVVKLFARVEDNDPAGPKGSESSVVEIHVISQKDMDQMAMTRDAMQVLQSKYAQAARRLEVAQAEAAKLREELARHDPTKPLSADDQAKLAKLSKDLADAAGDIDKLQAHDLPLDLDKALSAELGKMSSALSDASKTAAEAAKPGIAMPAAMDKLDQIKKKLGEEKQDFNDSATVPLEYLAQIFPLMQDQMRFIDIYNHQKDLAARLASLERANGQDDPRVKSRMRDLRDEQQHVRDDLRQLLDDIDSHVAALPADQRLDKLRNTATAFSKAVRGSPTDGQMQDAQTALDEFAGTPASMGASAAEQTLSSFIARCKGLAGEAKACLAFQPKLASGLGNTLDELLGMGGNSGSGSGGYSVMRNSLQNVGLYGTIPMMSRESHGGGGQADRGSATASDGSPDGQANPNSGNAPGRLHASGAGDAPVPQQYKKSVDEYYQRVDDELSQ